MRLLFLALVVAGCLAPSLPTTLATTDAAPALALHGCENLSGSFPVPSALAAAELPPGYRTRSAETTLRAVHWVVLVQCAASEVDGVATGEAWLAYTELDVVPPAGQGIEGAADHTVPLVTLASPAAVAEALVALGLPRVVAATDVMREELPGGAVRAHVAAEGAALQMVGAPTGATSTLGGGSWGVLGVVDGAVVARIRGTATGGVAAQAALQQHVDGGPALVAAAQPAARGGMVSGFGLAFDRVG